jgi:hypothetical protein
MSIQIENRRVYGPPRLIAYGSLQSITAGTWSCEKIGSSPDEVLIQIGPVSNTLQNSGDPDTLHCS